MIIESTCAGIGNSLSTSGMTGIFIGVAALVGVIVLITLSTLAIVIPIRKGRYTDALHVLFTITLNSGWNLH